MEQHQRTSRIALTIVMIGALLGTTLTAAFVASRDRGTELAIVPGLEREEGPADSDVDGEVNQDAETGTDRDDGEDATDGGDGADTDADETAAAVEVMVDEPAIGPGGECWGGDPYVPSEEELAASRDETENLAAIFDAAGIAYEVQTDTVGFTWLEWDFENAVAQSVSNSYYRQLYPLDPIPEEELAWIREENAGLMAAFDAAGIEYELLTSPDGWEWVEYDWDDPAAQAVADEYYAELYEYQDVPADEVLEQIRIENDGLAARLDEAGIDYERIVDADGWEFIEFDWDDPEAAEIAERYFAELYSDDAYVPEPIPEEELARIREENAGLMAAFDAAGVAYELVVEPDGWEWVEYDWDDPEAQAVADEYYATLYEGCAVHDGGDWQPTEAQIDRANAETDAMAAAFDAAGIEYTIENDQYGFTWVEWDYEDPAAHDVAEAYWRGVDQARIEQVRAELDVLEAAFVAAAVDFTREGGEECETIIFDVADATALAVVADVMAG